MSVFCENPTLPLFGRFDWCLITTACSRILDHVQTPVFDDPTQLLKAYKQTFESTDLWKMLFKSPPHLGVMNHRKIRLMWDQLRKRTEALVDKSLSPCESRILIESIKQYCPNDACMFLNYFVPSADITSAVKDAKCLLKLALTRFEMLNSFQPFFLEMAKEVSIKDLQFHQGYLRDRHKFMTHSTNATLKLIKEGGDFPKLAWLLDKVENLTTLSESQIFLQICRKNIADCHAELQVEDKREETDDQLTLSALFADEDDRSEITTAEEGITMETLLEIVQKKCVPEYEHRFHPFKEDKDMPLSAIDAIFKKFDILKEMKTAKDYLKLDISKTVNTALEHFKIAPKYHRRASDMRTILGVFGIENDDGPLLSSLKDIEKCQVDQNVTLRALSISMTRLLRVCKSIDESSWEIMRQLSLSQQLVDYLRDKKDQDFRNLIDAVEEHSEQCLKESEVNDFIEVQQFARPLVNGKFSRVEQFFETFQQCRKCGVGNVAKKIESCRYHLYSLKAFIRGVGNREELTHEIISNARQRGKFKFSLPKHGTIQLTLTYKLKKGKRVERHMDEIKDLRSRALLLSSSGKHRSDHHVQKTSRNACSVDDLQHFVDEVDMALRVCAILQELNKSGHFQFRHFEKAVFVSSQEEFNRLHQSLHDTLEQWILTLEASRKENYLLNFVHCDRLSDILSFFVDHKLSPETKGLLHFIDPRSKPDTHHPPPNVLCREDIGSKLDYIAMHLKLMPNIDVEHPCRKKIAIDPKQSLLTTGTSRQLQSIVSSGDLYLAVLDPNSKDVLPVVLELYWNTTGYFPTAHELLLCRADTTWEDIQLLLARYLYAPTPLLDDGLYCLANIEKLSSDVTRKLIEELSNILHILQPTLDQPDHHRKRLAVVCRGEDHHPFIDHFSDKAHRINGMSENAVRECITSLCPEVEIVTSDLPGMGKTEYIHTKATTSLAVLGVKTLRIGGPVSRKDLVQRLGSLRLSGRHLLHLDVTEIDGSFNLDEFIFELLVIGSVSSGSYYYQSPTQHVCIEVANAIHNTVLDSLMTARWFQRQDLKWDDYDSLIVSDEVTSSVQVVCHFLNAMSSDTLDEEDIEFSGPDKVKALAPWHCKHLLKSYFKGDTMSYSLVEIFLNALSSQLRKFSHSYYFKTASLRDMVGQSNTVRNTLVQEMVAVFEDFSKRSVAACRSGQLQVTKLDSTSGSSSVAIAAGRFLQMVQWSSENHLFFIFHGKDAHTVSPLYRDLTKVPDHIKDLFGSQVGQKLPDLQNLDSKQLQQLLEKIVTEKKQNTSESEDMTTTYALTPDNLLKMVLIYLRVKAAVPVVIMGETGCGKTRLVTYLAKTCGVTLEIFSIHAGVTATEIENKIEEFSQKAKQQMDKPVWVFLDEINTCGHLGLLTEIVCRRHCVGKEVSPNISFIAACNPYKLRGEKNVVSAGLSGKVKTDELSKLVYRVHPLPETMVDYVWDYGSLSDEDEKYYIEKMVFDSPLQQENKYIFAELLSISQRFIRKLENNSWCVSLRDVNRCKQLVTWFIDFLKRKQKHMDENVFTRFDSSTLEKRSIILALAHCYYVRLGKIKNRREYLKELSFVFEKHGVTQNTSGQHLLRIIQEEQKGIVDMMDVPSGTAKNSALLENVFVMLVCILNKIPVFVVGKPGCSKSLSMQLLKTNLRGQEARHPFFREYPQIYVVSYQGSESSTSEGIEKVFEKARKYQVLNKESNVLATVLLDEVGLAEVSISNPLKVLHYLLEPAEETGMKVAVVGISNWALDGAKMNRAIHLSRPDLEEEELLETAIAITQAKDDSKQLPVYQRLMFSALAKAYYEYQAKQKISNFHGLRDYYYLVKYLTKDESASQSTSLQSIWKGLLRNFGGLSSEMDDIINTFKVHLEEEPIVFQETENVGNVPTEDLIRENLADTDARHLLLVTSGDSVLDVVENILHTTNREYEIIFGSKFEDDRSEDYNYRILSRIILCMERGIVLILKNLESIYGSLYDMLNQNYTVMDRKKNCRVALGPFSNPMCYVHDQFRCIVLIDEKDLPHQDPPFLNRFEKQLIRFSDLLQDDEVEMLSDLETWIRDLTTVKDLKFEAHHVFPGFGKDTLASLALKLRFEGKTVSRDRIKEEILHVATPDGILRSCKADLANVELVEVREIQRKYFEYPIHEGLPHLLTKAIMEGNDQIMPVLEDQTKGVRFIILTHSSLYVSIKDQLQGLLCSRFEKLGAFRSEKELIESIHGFFSHQDEELLVFQCKPADELRHLAVLRATLENERREFLRSGRVDVVKHICIVYHLQRRHSEDENLWRLSYGPGWKIVTLDPVEQAKMPVGQVIGKTLSGVFHSDSFSLKESLKKEMLRCFVCINYTGMRRSAADIKSLIEDLVASDELLEMFALTILQYLKQDCSEEWVKTDEYGNIPYEYPNPFDSRTWQVKVACSWRDIYSSSTLLHAMQKYLTRRVKVPLAIIVYLLEDCSAWGGYFRADSKGKECWKHAFMSSKILPPLTTIPSPTGPECYFLHGPTQDTKSPFSVCHLRTLWKHRDQFMSEMLANTEIAVLKPRYQRMFKRELEMLAGSIEDAIPDLGAFIDDMCLFAAAEVPADLKPGEVLTIMRWCLVDRYCKRESKDNPVQFITSVILAAWENSDLVDAQLRLMLTLKQTVTDTDVSKLIQSVEQGSHNVTEQKTSAGLVADFQISDVDPNYLPDTHENEILSIRVGMDEFSFNDAGSISMEHQGDLTEPKRICVQTTDIAQTEVLEHDPLQRQVPSPSLLNEDVSACEGFTRNVEKQKRFSGEQTSYADDVSGGNAFPAESTFSIKPDFSTEILPVYHECDSSITENVDIGSDDDGDIQQFSPADIIEEIGPHDIHAAAEEQSISYENQLLVDNTNMLLHSEEGDMPTIQSSPTHDDSTDRDSADNGCLPTNDQLQQEEQFVDHVSWQFIPSSDVVKSCGGVMEWQRKVGVILAIATEISVYPSSLHLLRVFQDFVHIIVKNEPQFESVLYDLVNTAMHVKDADEEPIESECLAAQVLEFVHLKQGKSLHCTYLQEFICAYIWRCMEANIENPLFAYFLDAVKNQTLPDRQLTLFGPILFQQFLDERVQKDCLSLDYLMDESEITIPSAVGDVHTCLSTCHDSALGILTSDILHDYFVMDISAEDVAALVSSDDSLLRKVKQANEVIAKTHTCGFPFACAVSFLKTFLEALADAMCQREFYSNEEICKRILALTSYMFRPHLNQVNGGQKHLFCYLLKAMMQREGLPYVINFCQEYQSYLPQTVQEFGLTWEASFSSHLGYNPLGYATHYLETNSALSALIHENQDPMMNIVGKCHQSSLYRFSLLAVLFANFYLSRFSRPLNEHKNKAAEWILEKCKSLPIPYQETVCRLLGKRDFEYFLTEDGDFNTFSPTSQQTFQGALYSALAIHIQAVIVSKTECNSNLESAFAKSLLAPETLQTLDTLISSQTEAPSRQSKRPVFDQWYCQCGNMVLMITGSKTEKIPNCPNCARLIGDQVKSDNETSVSNQTGNTEISVKYIQSSSVSFHVIHLLLQSCFAAGLSSKLCSRGDMAAKFSCAVEEVDRNILERMRKHVGVLGYLLAVETHGVFEFLHLFISRLHHHFAPSGRCRPIDQLVDEIQDLTVRRHGLIKEFKKQCFSVGRQDEPTVSTTEQQQLLEIYNTDMCLDDSAAYFRLTSKPTLANLRSEFETRKHSKHYPFLEVFLITEDRLKLIKHIPVILNWHRMVTMKLDQRIARDEASQRRTSTFVEETDIPEFEKENLRTAYKTLRATCKFLRDDPLATAVDPCFKKLPNLDKQSSNLGECVIDSETSPFYVALRALVKIQNTFLDDCMYAALAENSMVLSYMRRGSNVGMAKYINLEDCMKKHVIEYDWSDEIFSHSQQCNIAYGMGRDMQYDYRVIEAELANKLVMGKPYLKVKGGIHFFRFAKELFHGSSFILEEVKSLIPQERILPSDIINSVKRDHERSLNKTSDLLNELEVLLCFIKRTGGQSDMSLLEYATQWLSTSMNPFPERLLPEPRDSVKLCHIVPLYELLEDLQSDDAVDCLPDNYREELSAEMTRTLTECMESGAVLPDHFRVCLRRFIFRFLSSDVMVLQPTDSLVDSIDNPTLWPAGVMVDGRIQGPSAEPKPLTDVLPCQLSLCHTHAVYKQVLNVIEEREKSRQRNQVFRGGASGPRGPPRPKRQMQIRKT